MKISLLIKNGYGMGGTIRTVFNIAEGLVGRGHKVEIVSMVQHRATPFFDVPAGVAVRAFAPTPTWANRPRQGLLARWREQRPNEWLPESEVLEGDVFNARTERAMRDFLRKTDSDVVVGTRPGLNLMLARWAPKRLLTIGQEHVHLGNHSEGVRTAVKELYPRLDGLTVLTEADRKAYEELLPAPSGWLAAMPNALPPGDYPRSRQDNPIIAAAGRLAPIKQYGKLIDGFAVVAERHPEWQLRIYGNGKRKQRLQEQAAKLGLHNQVIIADRTKDLTGELAKASILGVSSRAEGFGMTIIEAFAVGLPVVSFDCPHGPREIITHEHDGLLVPPQDAEALGAALLRLVENPRERTSMGEAALSSIERYALPVVVEQWEEFLTGRLAEKSAPAPSR